MGHDRDPAIHFGAGVKVPFNHRVSGRFDLRDVMTQKGNGAEGGKQTHHPELQLGVTFTFERTEPPAPRDRDYDGLYDREDACPDVGALTLDGCPLDTDDDAILDADDHCPREFGPAPSGCPVLDADADGIVIPVDQCPTEPGILPDGCPETDPDSDGLEGKMDGCPEEPEVRNGFEDDDGCPDQVPEAVAGLSRVVSEIRFKKGTAEPVEGSLSEIQATATVLLKYPSVRLEVTAHTSDEAQLDSNLSQARAEAVRQVLIDQGLQGDRVVARGAGSSEPLAESSDKARAVQNERIEFKVLVQP
jgi:outer membrane protein OmpA-like peptidoglycan-associated protein